MRPGSTEAIAAKAYSLKVVLDGTGGETDDSWVWNHLALSNATIEILSDRARVVNAVVDGRTTG